MCSKVRRFFFVFEIFNHLLKLSFYKVRGYPNRVSSPVAVHATNTVSNQGKYLSTPMLRFVRFMIRKWDSSKEQANALRKFYKIDT